MTKRMGVAAVFLVGCAVGGASSQLVVPKANAQQAATLPKWEYFCTETFRNHDYLLAAANKLGREGWEPAGLEDKLTPTGERWCFKRAKM